MPTVKGLTRYAAALAMLTATACSTTMTAGTATETAIFDAWESSLPTRSRQDTPETQRSVGRAYDIFEAVTGRRVQ